ncbi:MAG: thiamine pyrophosphate-dependent enzyme [Anaerolineaceae bacterium]|nr:thiamine pyrophosphate-dependent enzyme [Anaerolineaceae bacterium]
MSDNIPELPLTNEQLINDYRLGYRSRQASIIGRREVLTGKAKFGIFGDGKELIQLNIAHHFRKGDWRSGYYRDQTWMMALDLLTLEQFFAQLYAHADPNFDPHSGGRNMNGHFASQLIDQNGEWLSQSDRHNSSADAAPTASQMPRSVGLAYASVLYREIEELKQFDKFSNNGNEVAWVSIGNASTAEGPFWEAVNAIGVLKAPAIISIYDDGYGISVPNEFQMVKENISAILSGFQRIKCPADECDRGYDIYTVEAWNFPAMWDAYARAEKTARDYHIPSIIHVCDVTQPLGHSTSGSHERYKSKERLEWEVEYDSLRKFREYLVKHGVATDEQFDQWEAEDKKTVEQARKTAWEAFQNPIKETRQQASDLIKQLAQNKTTHAAEIKEIEQKLMSIPDPLNKDIAEAVHKVLISTNDINDEHYQKLFNWNKDLEKKKLEYYNKFLYSDSKHSPLLEEGVPAKYSENSPMVMGFEVINKAFDEMLAREPRMIAFGEDVGNLGDVNQGFRGLQDKYGSLRVTDTGIREATILGQGIGLALRGLRPIAEIQYLDYLLYALQIMADDLSNLRWRTAGRQQAPLIVRTRGHRLEGIFHSGSPMAGVLNLVRGMHVLVPRNLTQAAGFYNTLIEGDDPALIIEVLNGYRFKERMPDNIAEFKLPLGVPEIMREGTDLSLVTYGATVRIAENAVEMLAKVGIDVELIDVQSLLPFDRYGMIKESITKTCRVLFVDEDVPGGASAYMLDQVLNGQDAWQLLDSPPQTLSAAAHRPAYGTDGDYYSKPNAESIFDKVYEIMHESNPQRFPLVSSGGKNGN